ncbi:type II toxin-antitoxin system RnlA family toxin [Otariodibacter oris]|uniref:RnlA-like RNase toxin of RnlAB toxin-antitoxin system n=1 Tax=Otariodibacter oris TaxID=1032623 RepID=A0A420XHI8_9PAST|nr:type II toxin-antitoxin system RnlA family toxin [Otariodibacter oris]QGM81031.1 hypothetical protein A6A10_06240 [Otariodibacter oris]RKR76785.1 RnlA-like RNase toxin of RnlAB toxin-antitoxin system [Otariodibacter oris]
MDEFTDLNLDREKLKNCLEQFCKKNEFHLEFVEDKPNKKTFKIIKSGLEPARLVFHLKKSGATTIQINEGKNKKLNCEIAEYIKLNLCQEEIKSLNILIKGISNTTMEKIFSEIESIQGINKINITPKKINGGTLYELKSETFDDQLNLSYYDKNHNLLIQGRPLSCYKVVAYSLSMDINTDTLARILYKKDDCEKNIARPETSESLLKMKLPKSYDNLPKEIKNLLISSCCIRAASPNLPEYSMLTYCELKALEGIIKSKLVECQIVEIPNNVGELFEIPHDPKAITLKNEILQQYKELNQIKTPIEAAYKYYRARRHSLFHMQGFIHTSSKVDSLQAAINICDKVYSLIEGFY